MGAWQQLDDPPPGASEDLRRRIGEAVASWSEDLDLPVRPVWQVNVDSQHAADINGLEMSLPVIWQEGNS